MATRPDDLPESDHDELPDGSHEAYADMDGFRDEDRLVELGVSTCLRLLSSAHVGRLAVNDPAGPVVFPVNYTVDGGTVLFRTTMGTKLAAAEAQEAVAFQVDHVDVPRRLGWSVLVRGRLAEVTDPDEIERLGELPLEPFAGGTRDHYVRVLAASITGRRIPIPRVIPDDWLTVPSTGNVWRGRDGDDLLG